MSRFTRKDLDDALTTIYATAAKLGSIYSLEAQSRNGYTGLDLFRGKVCERNVTCGTPRECSAAAYEWLDGITIDHCAATLGV